MDDTEFQNLLFTAIQHRNDALLDDLLEGDNCTKFIDRPGEDGLVPLHLAVIKNDLRCVECLLKHGANPNVFDLVKARTPLHLAVNLGFTDIVRAFLELDHVDLKLRDDRNLTCQEIAEFCDNQSLADLIKDRYDEIERLKNDFYTIMNQACDTNDSNLVRELLDKYGSQILDRLPKGWRAKFHRNQFARLCIKELINWSSSSWNEVTLLFKASSKGYTEICKLLIDYGATAKCNENTNYSPLYVAAYGGFTDTVKLLLDNFPYLIREITIEKWTVLHACCLKGHSDTARLILNYPYPDGLKGKFVSRSGHYEYHFAFDLNAQDAAGQTVIYLAVSANNEKLLDTLLEFKIEAKILSSSDQTAETLNKSGENFTKSNERGPAIPRRARIIPDRPKSNQGEPNFSRRTSNQLDKIIKQLKMVDLSNKSKGDESHVVSNEVGSTYTICPFDMDTYCDYNSKTALHLAVSQQYHSIATVLLVNGSNPSLPILSRDSIKNDFAAINSDIGLNWLRSSKSTCLKEAARLNDEVMCEILIRYGASDNQDNLALQVAASNKNKSLISKFLSLKSIIDPEFKINQKCNVEFASRFKQTQRLSKTSQGSTTTTFSSMFPSMPVMIDWQNLKCIKQIDEQWLIEASLVHNKRLKHPTNSLMAITRLDLSSNNLKTVHPVIFRLPSLRELNLSNNRLETLIMVNDRGSAETDTSVPTSKLIESHKIAMKRSKSSNLSSINLESSNIIDINEPQEWDLPYLETLDLHDNLLISLPDCLFELPRLSELDVSSNQIRQLPWAIWTAPNLKELIASGNLLDDLPKVPPQSSSSTQQKLRSEIDVSFTEGRLSVNQNIAEDSIRDSIESDSNKDQSSLTHIDNQIESLSYKIDCTSLPVDHLNYWSKKVDIVSDALLFAKNDDDDSTWQRSELKSCKITYMNLSHNSFETIPPALACLAPELTRLNLSHNRITGLGDIGLYPFKLKTLDLSNNRLTSWFVSSGQETDLKHCYSDVSRKESCNLSIFLSGHSNLFCSHKTHQRLENLKLINLSHNGLELMQIKMPANLKNQSRSPVAAMSSNEESKRDNLLYPNITAIDVSYNRVQQIPKGISELKDLSVLNLSGNSGITSLPAELGLASKLWNLGINGCNLNEPLKSIVEAKTYKTMDVIGYLRSILEEAKPYARMKLMLVGLQGIGKTSLLEQMRLEGSTGNRRRAPEHWTKRMGHSTKSNIRNQRGVTLSTVGVDIHDWVFHKRIPRNQPNFGPVSFSTWDFGGQQEFYATHRYFLSRRSVYLVVWRLTDDLDGISGIQQWLVNIQSRASGSPVIIVATHEDMIEGGEKGPIVQRLQSEVFKRFIDVADHDKCGLPRVMDSIVVSTKTKLNIKNLCNRIYDVVFSLRSPGSTERLLEQKIPATYLYLEEIVSSIVRDRQQSKREPVLTYNEYRRLTSEQLKLKYNKDFRDLEDADSREVNYNSELQQATRFLHENGVLLHYEDSNLRDLYFLDPQWLCDILSHVITIREINPHVKNGLMKIDDLAFLFKSMDVNLSGGVQAYVVNLLNKFEVALTWNSQYLLIPSLLPSDPTSITEQQDFKVKVTQRMRGRSAVRRYESNSNALRSTSIGPTEIVEEISSISASKIEMELQPNNDIYRLILLRYLPAGFLARLQSGMLSNPEFEYICADIFASISSRLDDDKLRQTLGGCAGWKCWKKGIKLSLQQDSTINCGLTSSTIEVPLVSISEISTMSRDSKIAQEKYMVECSQVSIHDTSSEVDSEKSSNKWCEFDVTQYSNIMLISINSWRLKITEPNGSVQFIEPECQFPARLLSNAADQIDNLLEDWYPSLGARFAHTLGGNYLVTRVVPCLNCSARLSRTQDKSQRASRLDNRRSKVNFTLRTAQDPSNDKNVGGQDSSDDSIYCYYVEHCILQAYNINSDHQGMLDSIHRYQNTANTITKVSKAYRLRCPRHGVLNLNSIAPDILFEDIPNSYKINNNQIERCKLIGRGTFGFVFKGILKGLYPRSHLCQVDQEVALKLLQPVNPGPEADNTDLIAFKSARSNWIREPFHCACKSYCIARHEINILQALSHPNIVNFIGLCVKPLAIVLELAPLGCLSDIFRNYKRSGVRIDQYSVQKTLIQIARALEFLHQQRVIYRDLKAENVLVWNYPSPFATQPELASVEVKLADYGISRHASSTGIWKGFAGTINFLAPEILRHNGDEEYTEKVDCFSFGMFMYELLTFRPPFKHNEGSKSHLTDGRRPTLSLKDLVYPNYVIDLMSICWSQEPHLRPTASQIVSIVSTPEFMQLLDVVPIRNPGEMTFCSSVEYIDNYEHNLDLWFGEKSFMAHILSANQSHWTDFHQISQQQASTDHTSMCVVDHKIWLCDKDRVVHILPVGARSLGQVDVRRLVSVESNKILNTAQQIPLDFGSHKTHSTIKDMIYVASYSSVLFLMDDGTIWLCCPQTMSCKQLDDNSIEFLCMAIPNDADNSVDSLNVYCGQSGGISCLEILEGEVHRQMILPLAGTESDLNGEPIVEPSQPTEVTTIVASKDALWTAAGCTVHLWDVSRRTVIRKLDCWKLVPCSESLESINIELYYHEARSSIVTSMAHLNDKLFVGTSHGCFTVIEASSLKPVIVFRPYESDIKILKPIVIQDNADNDGQRYLVTIGRGYRDLMKRYVNSLDGSMTSITDAAILWSAKYYSQ